MGHLAAWVRCPVEPLCDFDSSDSKAFPTSVGTSAGLQQRAQQDVYYFRATERTAGNRYHVHALLAGTEHLPVDAVQDAWREGFAQARQYDRTRNGVYYVTKSLIRPNADYDLQLPPRRENL